MKRTNWTPQKKHPKRAEGFTIVELLVAVAILAILTAVLTTTLTGTLSLNRQSQRQLDSTATAQRVIESVRGAWNTIDSTGNPTNYDRVCVPNYTQPTGYTVQFINLDSRANPLTGSTATNVVFRSDNNCAAATINPTTGSVPAMRRIIVSSPAGGQAVTLRVDVLRP